jgi:excisionase family DNA binding protein
MSDDVRIAEKIAMSPAQAGKLANVGVHSLRAAIKDGSLRSHSVGRRLMVKRSDLEAWVDTLPSGAGGKGAGKTPR